MTRSFVAIDLPDAVRSRLAGIGGGCPGARGVPEENLHVTLAFLGDVRDAALEELHDRLQAIRAAGFDLKIEGIGTFGGPRPRVLWAGIRPEPRLRELHKSVRRAVRGAGIELAHARFTPHVTIARFPSGLQAEPEGFQRFAAAHAGLSFGPVPIRSFALCESILNPGGARYTELAAYPLGS